MHPEKVGTLPTFAFFILGAMEGMAMKKKTIINIPESVVLRAMQNRINELEQAAKDDLRLLYVGWGAIGKLFGRVSARTMKRMAKAAGWTFRKVNGRPAVSAEELERMIKRLPRMKF